VGKITSAFWDTLNIKFENVNYRQLDSVYQRTIDDHSIDMLIYHNDTVKHIRGQEASFPKIVRITYNWLMTSIKQIELQRVTDSLVFQTIVEKPDPPEFISPAVEDE
jgi:hypothetical protein